MVFTDRGSVVSYVGEPTERGVTGAMGAGALEIFFTGGSDANLASIFPISLACAKGGNLEIRSASFEPVLQRMPQPTQTVLRVAGPPGSAVLQPCDALVPTCVALAQAFCQSLRPVPPV